MPKGKSKRARSAKPVAEQAPPVTAEERYRMIAEAAYFRAEKRGFVGDDLAEDWLQAEREIDRLLQARGPEQAHAPVAGETAEQVEAAFETHPEALSERVREITLQALSGGRLDKQAIKKVMTAVVKGAKQGAARRGDKQKEALRDAMRGLDEALAAAAEATQLAIQEAAGRKDEFSQQGLKRAADELAALESLFIETLGDAGRTAKGFAQETLRDLAEHARASGTAVGGRVQSALSQLAQAIAETARGQKAAGTKALREEASLLAHLAVGVLQGVAARFQSTPKDKAPPPPSDRPE